MVSLPPLARDDACVTCPVNFVPLGRIARLSVDFMGSVVCASTASPLFAFFASIVVSSSALMPLPVIDAPLFAVSEGRGDCAIAPAAAKIAGTRRASLVASLVGFIKNLL